MGNLGAFVVSSLLVGLIFNVQSSNGELKDIYSWKNVDYKYPNATLRQDQVKSGVFVPDNIIATGMGIWKNKLFIATPRAVAGVPATLSYINLDDKSQGESPSLIPYPDWESQQIDKIGPKTIVSVYKIDIDVCDRLWMIDTGLEVKNDVKKQIRTPRIFVFDLKTDKLIHEYELKNGVTPASIVVDVAKDKCDQAFAYSYDKNGAFVYDFKNKDSWTIKRDNSPGDFDVRSMSLTPANAQGERTLYLRPPKETEEFTVSTKTLQSKAAAKIPASPIGCSAFDAKTGVAFFVTLPNLKELKCWNSVKNAKSPSTTALVPVKETTPKALNIVYSDTKVDDNGNLWLLRNNKFFGPGVTGTQLIISSAPVAEAVKGTACA